MIRELKPKDLAWRCPAGWLPRKDSTSIKPASTIVAQDRAVEAIAFGLAMRGIGFNVFVTGMSGTGRLTTIKSFVEKLAEADDRPEDICFVFNFRKPEEPSAIFLEAGAGFRLKEGMEELIEDLSTNLPVILNDRDFRSRIDRAVEPLQRKERQVIEAFEKEVADAGFVLVQVQAGLVTRPEILPVVDEQPVPLEKIQELLEEGKLSTEDVERLRKTHAELSEKFRDVFQEVAEIRRMTQERVEDVRRKLLQPSFDEAVKRIRKDVGDPRANPYLDDVATDLGENLELFMVSPEDVPMGGDRFLRWRVNLVVDNTDVSGRPVVIETEPTYTNLFGTIERTLTQSGEAATSFMRIRAGSLMRANGGFLVLNADDVLLEPRVWPGLKRALKYRRVQIQSLESLVLGAALLKPEPVPIDVKVIIIGSRSIYDLLFRYDSDFPKIFKVLADFDMVLTASKDHAKDVLSVLRRVTVEEGLRDLDRSGMSAMLEAAVRIGKWRRRFSSRFSDLADILREASYRAGLASSKMVSAEHVIEARRARRRRHSLTEDRSHELIKEGIIRVETSGAAVGQVNGLAVYDLGHHRFGKPSRITAQVGLGRDGVVNVERQAGLSGPTHSKGVSILTGFLRGTFARRSPLTMSCSITFEQSYGGIDGDSASSTEIYAIVSAISGISIRQDVAVTGSVDQYGYVQAIGGVNEKIEGFHRVCSEGGLTGSQGVMIPAANVGDLHLSDEVVDSVTEGLFTIWAVDDVSDGIGLLTGKPAGEWSEKDGWSEGSVFAACQDRLDEMVRLMRKAVKEPGKNGGENPSSENDTENDS
ncbi:MAG: AAA family ATPase [Acidobacteria bacterium]|jgi:predicted ATP-dependent protease|nr:AAA family ATPase [Acidobacteriota bacterium]